MNWAHVSERGRLFVRPADSPKAFLIDTTLTIVKILMYGCLVAALILLTQGRFRLQLALVHPSEQKEANERHYNIIELAEAIRLFNTKDALFLDVRQAKYYNYGSIEGAVNLELDKIADLRSATVEKWNSRQAVVIYCGGSDCATSYMADEVLAQKGLTNTLIYERGWMEWRSCKLPMKTSPALERELNSDE